MQTDFLLTPEYEFLQKEPHLKDNLMCLALGGSKAYGTDLPTSDTDVRGIAFPLKNEILLNTQFEQVEDRPTDTVIYNFNKFMELCSQCNPNVIEMLGQDPDRYLYTTEEFMELYKNRDMFLSKRAAKTFGGYATQQLYRLRQKSIYLYTPEEYNAHIAKVLLHMINTGYNYGVDIMFHSDANGITYDINGKNIPSESLANLLNEINNVIKVYNTNSERNQKAIEHGKINKHAMHLLRLYMMAVDILQKGQIVTYREKEHDLLMSVRNGEFCKDGMMTDEFWRIVDKHKEKFEFWQEHTHLPDKPDFERINEFKLNINEKVIKNELTPKLSFGHASPTKTM